MTEHSSTFTETVAVDFDGVIHNYDKWRDGSIYGGPIDGAIIGIRELMQHYAVFILSSRNPFQIAEWLQGFGFKTLVEVEDKQDSELWGPDSLVKENWTREFWNEKGVLLITRRKLAAKYYLDDHGVHFVDWSQALQVLLYNKTPPEEVADKLGRLEDWLHSRRMHPDYDYMTTDGPRKAWPQSNVPPEGDGWERNITSWDPRGWERFDYHEESYWRRPHGAAPA